MDGSDLCDVNNCSLGFWSIFSSCLRIFEHTSLTMTEGEICKLGLNCFALKFMESWILNYQSLKNCVEIVREVI